MQPGTGTDYTRRGRRSAKPNRAGPSRLARCAQRRVRFRLIGLLIYRLGTKSRSAAAELRRQQSPEQIVAADPKAVQIMVRDIVDARLTTRLLSAKLKLSLVDEMSPTYTWARSDNQTKVVRGVLRAALGTRLIDQEKAA